MARLSTKYLALLATLLATSESRADPVSITRRGATITSITAGGVTVPLHELIPGRSSGDFAQPGQWDLASRAADDRNLRSYFTRSSGSEVWDVAFTGWTDSNGSDHDFFLFEVGGGEVVRAVPRLSGGALGLETTLSGWTDTGYTVDHGPLSGQSVYGLAFKRSDLRRADGTPLPANVVLEGIRFLSPDVDPASFLAVDPSPSGGPGTNVGIAPLVTEPRVVWQPLEVLFRGPWAHEASESPNPFLDYRLIVRFTHSSGETHWVPGFFDGNGNGKSHGYVWKVRWRPTRPGNWSAEANFKEGPQIALDPALNAGTTTSFHGESVTFLAEPADPEAPGFFGRGGLVHAGEHYGLHEDGSYFIKTGANSPENFLAYRGFDDTLKELGGQGVLHSYGAHVGDWQPGDPNFQSNTREHDGRGIIGALNYLSDVGVNSLFMMLMNRGGDGEDVHPFLEPYDNAFSKRHYDLSRLDQWDIVFRHAAQRGIALHFGLAETEQANENWLDDGQLGVERKLFYREMVARFAYLPAIKWNLCEENDYTVSELRAFADYILALDPWDHPVAFHNHPDDLGQYNQVAGDERFSATSQQYTPASAGSQVEDMRALSAASGHPWIVEMDENNPWQTGLTSSNAAELRKQVLYDVLFSGGHVEWYMGWTGLSEGGDLSVEDFRTRDEMWRWSAIAREFLERHTFFWQMEPDDSLVLGEPSSPFGGAQCLASPGDTYVVYLPLAGSSSRINLNGHPGAFQARWFDPRSGLFVGGPWTLAGGGVRNLGAPPTLPEQDWVVLVERPVALRVDRATTSASREAVLNFRFDASPREAGRPWQLLGSLEGSTPGTQLGSLQVPLNTDRYFRTTLTFPDQGFLLDSAGLLDAYGTARGSIRVGPQHFGSFVGDQMLHAVVLHAPLDYVSESTVVLLQP